MERYSAHSDAHRYFHAPHRCVTDVLLGFAGNLEPIPGGALCALHCHRPVRPDAEGRVEAAKYVGKRATRMRVVRLTFLFNPSET